MAHFYCYLLDDDGRIKAREILTAENDDEAVDIAEQYLADHETIPGVEVWQGERQVRALKRMNGD